jgi:Flp pilus assembly protein CpaB
VTVIRKIQSSHKRLILAILAGAAAAVLMFLYAGNLEAQSNSAQRAAIEEYGGTRTEVLVATRDIMAGEELSAENTAMMPWLSDLLPRGTITDPSQAYGKTLSIPVWSNEPILAVKLGGSEELIRVPDGLTAVSIPIRDDMAVGGSLLPGSAVDIYAVGVTKVSLVLADVLVLEASNGFGMQTSGGSEEAGVVLGGSSRATLKWVTLAVSDESVAELLQAARDNTLCLVLPGNDAGAALDQAQGGEAGPASEQDAAASGHRSAGNATVPPESSKRGGQHK